jgi:hypothetical protein
MIFNRSKNAPYYSQRNNKKRPASACNVTSATQACAITDNKFWHPQEVQPEDYLMELLESREAWNLLNTIFPGAIINPWNTSHCIAWAVNNAVGKRICRVETVTLREMLHHLILGGAVVVGGKFTRSGHFVCLVGFETSQDVYDLNNADDINISEIQRIIIDDPWGDYTRNYQNHNGNDVFMPLDEFKKLIFGNNNVKTAQMYYQSGAIG